MSNLVFERQAPAAKLQVSVHYSDVLLHLTVLANQTRIPGDRCCSAPLFKDRCSLIYGMGSRGLFLPKDVGVELAEGLRLAIARVRGES